MKWLEKIVDDTLKRMSEEEIQMKFPDPNMPKAMVDSTIPIEDDWIGWKPMPSVLKDADLNNLEKMIGFELPKTYRHFLKYKHFYQLSILDHAVNIHAHLPNKDLSDFKELFFETYDPDDLIKKGYLYFADFQDYGLLCFDSNIKRENNEYPIVYIDHEDLTDIHIYAKNFKEVLENDSENGNRFILKLNEFYKQ